MIANTPFPLLLSLIVSTAALVGCQRLLGGGGGQHLERAEELTRKGELGGAIESYQSHIAYRLAIKDRPSWENPYFYELLIGDLELRRGDIDGAVHAYERAEKAGVEPGLVSDRYRSLGSRLEQERRFTEALEILKRYRDRDPLLFDAMLDRIAKELTAAEERPAASSQATPVPPPAP